MNICSKGLLSLTIFGLKSAGKTGDFFSSIFRDMGNVMPVVFGEIKMSFWVRKKISEKVAKSNKYQKRQQQLVNSGITSVPIIF